MQPSGNTAYLNAGYEVNDETRPPPYTPNDPQNYPPPNVDAPNYTPPGGPSINSTETTGRGPVVDDSEPWLQDSFNDKSIRLGFIRKVYLILVAQLTFTFGTVCVFIYVLPIRQWIQAHAWVVYPAYVVFIISYIVLACCPQFRRKWPANIICLVIFTVAFTYVAATVSAFYSTVSVLIAMGVTVGVCLSISLFSCQTKFDFTKLGGVLYAALIALVFIAILVPTVYFTYGVHGYLHVVLGSLFGILFSMFLAYDTQILMGGRKYQLSPEEYIFGSLQLYLDVVFIFIIILSCFGGQN